MDNRCHVFPEVGMAQCKPSSLTIGEVVVNQDAHGRYSLNDLHRAAGGEDRHKPVQFLRLASTVALVDEIKGGDSHLLPVETVHGRSGGTYVTRPLVYAYAAWVSAAFHLKVLNIFDAYVQGELVATSQTTALAVPQTYIQALEALLTAEKEKERLAIEAAQQRKQLAAQAPAVAFVGRYVEAVNTKSIREVVKILGLKERAFVKALIADGVMFRQGRRLLPTAEYQHRGYFEVKTGESNGYAFHQPRFTPAGVTWAAKRYGKPEAA